MSIVKTRYRDIPWEEAKACAAPGEDTISREEWDSEYRGKPVSLITPADGSANYFICSGPYFKIATLPTAAVCPHIAEIGD